MLTRVFVDVCSAIGQKKKVFALSARQIAVISTLHGSISFWFMAQTKNQIVSLLYLVALGFASVLYARAAMFLRGALKEGLSLQVSDSISAQQFTAAYKRTAVMVKRVLIYIACTVVTVPAYAALIPEARATGLGMRNSLPGIFALLAMKLEFGVIVTVIAVYCVEPYRLRVAQARRRTSATTIKSGVATIATVRSTKATVAPASATLPSAPSTGQPSQVESHQH